MEEWSQILIKTDLVFFKATLSFSFDLNLNKT